MSIGTPTALADAPSLHDDPIPSEPSPANPLASHRQSQEPAQNSPPLWQGLDSGPLFPHPLRINVCLLVKCTRHLRRTSQPLEQTVHSARLVAHFILGLYPISDLARRLEAPLRHLLCQSPFFLCAQITRRTPASLLMREHLLHTCLSIPAHPRLYRPIMDPHHRGHF